MSIPPDNRIRFQPSAANTGCMTTHSKWESVPITKDGIPVKAGDLRTEQTYSVDCETGELVEVVTYEY